MKTKSLGLLILSTISCISGLMALTAEGNSAGEKIKKEILVINGASNSIKRFDAVTGKYIGRDIALPSNVSLGTIAVSVNNTIWVPLAGSTGVINLNIAGEKLTSDPRSKVEVAGCWAIAFGPNDQMYAASTRDKAIYKVDKEGRMTELPSANDLKPQNVRSMAIATDGTLFCFDLADRAAGISRILKHDGKKFEQIVKFKYTNGQLFFSENQLFACIQGNGLVKIDVETGNKTMIIPAEDPLKGNLVGTTGVTLLPEGDLLIASYTQNGIKRFNLNTLQEVTLKREPFIQPGAGGLSHPATIAIYPVNEK